MKILVALPALLILIQDPDPATVDAWVRQLGHEDVAIREEATRKLVALGEKVLPLLEKHETTAAGEIKVRLAAIRRRLTPFKLGLVFDIAEEALKEGAKVEEWKPKLKGEVDRLFELLGDHVPAKRRDRIHKAVKEAFWPEAPEVRKGAEKYGRAVVVLDKATGKELEAEVLLICRTCEVEDLKDSVVICLGDVRVREMSDALVIARGNVEATREIDPSVLFAGGAVKCGGEIEDSAILAMRGVEARESNRCAYINGTKRTMEREKWDVDADIKGLPRVPPK